MKYAAPDTVVAVRGGQAGPSNVFLTVTNVATPIAAEDLERMFQPFVQLDPSTSGTTSGLGLGLHIVRRVVDLHEGSIDVTHHDGCVTFRVTLPLAAAHLPSQPAEAGLPEASATPA
jgi:signal transduction histidine kinase